MKKIFLSLPMSGRTDEEIRNDISEMKKIIGKHYVEHGTIEDDIICLHNQDMQPSESQLKETVTKNLLYLGSAIMTMATCDAVVFRHGWPNARSCRVEHGVAWEYGIPCYIITEDGRLLAEAIYQNGENFWYKVSNEMKPEVIRAYKEWKEEDRDE